MGDLAGWVSALTWSVTAMSREVRGRSWVWGGRWPAAAGRVRAAVSCVPGTAAIIRR